MNAREVALAAVRDAFAENGPERTAQEALDYRATKAALDARDRAFATELAYGAIKMRRTLDWLLQPFIGERAATLPRTTLEVLRLAVYELRYTRADAHATVSEFVEIAKRHGHRGLAALVNAVLRSFLRAPPRVPTRDAFENEDEYFGTALSLPTWLVRQWRAVFGDAAVERICTGVNDPAQVAVTANGAATRDEVGRRLAHDGIATEPSAFVPESLIVTGSGARLDERAAGGAWWRQSESAAMPVAVLQPQPGERIADLCSGRGNKALQIAARLENEGELWCVDDDARKMRVLGERFAAAGRAAVTHVGDVRALEPGRRFDRVLLDTPCSGIGVVGRHPEARWKKHGTDGERLAAVQTALLAAAAALLDEGGVLVYAVCSTDPREGVEVVNAFLARNRFARGLVPAQLAPFVTPDGDVLVPPGIDGRDGFYVARLDRSL